MNIIIPARPIDAAAIVKVDNLHQARYRAIVHIGPAARHVPQGRSLECMLQLYRIWKQPAAAWIAILGDADVMERPIGKSPTTVAYGAVCFAIEQSKTPFCRCANGCFLAMNPSIKRSVGRYDGTLVGG